jgi:hypothetical protein
MALALTVCAGGAQADTIVMQSNGSTLAAATSSTFAGLTTGDTTGVTFGAALVGSFGTGTPLPPGAPAGTAVINIPPGGGQNGFFEIFFNLASGATNISLSGAANVDDQGYIFINGHQIGYVTEYGDATFSTNVASNFVTGTNQLLVSDINSGGGPSGAAFFADVTYTASGVPESATWFMMLAGFAAVGIGRAHRAKKSTARLAAG